jgi:hypothetical protein
MIGHFLKIFVQNANINITNNRVLYITNTAELRVMQSHYFHEPANYEFRLPGKN